MEIKELLAKSDGAGADSAIIMFCTESEAFFFCSELFFPRQSVKEE